MTPGFDPGMTIELKTLLRSAALFMMQRSRPASPRTTPA
jgi:hypothetical protein